MPTAKKRYYFDYNATTPLDPGVVDRMLSALVGPYGNPSSVHAEGRSARELIECARAQVAVRVGCDPSGVIFESGASEANNHALRGVMRTFPLGSVLVTSAVEHPSLLGAARALAAEGYRWWIVPVDTRGHLDLDAYRDALATGPALVSVMTANNETGTMFPIAKLADWAHAAGALFHTDAVQAFGRIPVSMRAMDIDLLSISGHKIYGPKGCGALCIRSGLMLAALVAGGHQERGRRAGTEATFNIVGFGEACQQLDTEKIDVDSAKMASLVDKLWRGIHANVPETFRVGDPDACLPSTLSVRFARCDAESLLFNLDLAGVAASSGSACTSGSIEPSHVLLAMGLTDSEAKEVVRFSVGRFSEVQDVEYLLTLLPELVRRTRAAVTKSWHALETKS